MTWKKIPCSQKELHLLGTLSGGQSFRWSLNKETREWTGVFSKTVWRLRQDEECLEYQILGSLYKTSTVHYNPELNNKQKTSSEIIFENMLRKYFRLDMNLNEHYKTWMEKDEFFKLSCQQFYGIRMLDQEPVENLFSFICSQNNHISRISSMVEKLCSQFGEEICELEDTKYFSFPEVEKLAQPEVESTLRKLGFGYRAKFIQKSATQIVECGGDSWFKSLQDMKYKEARQELMKLHGIGPKVADCISLMSLNHLEALPVDTHVYQIASQHYLPHLRGKKNVTEKMYVEIGDHFRSLYGNMAGWAHTVLFCADLKKFQQKDDEDEVKPKKKRSNKKSN